MSWHVWLTALLTGINGTYYVVYNKQEDVRFLLIHNQNVLVSSLSKLRRDFIFHSVKQAGGRSDRRAGVQGGGIYGLCNKNKHSRY